MPSIFTKSSPFVSLRPDNDCGRQTQKTPGQPSSSQNYNGVANDDLTKPSQRRHYSEATSHQVHGNSKSRENSHARGNGSNRSYSPDNEDEFLRLSSPQQDVLLLHGPRQKYSLEKAKKIPELRGDDEILVQVLAIGLNPVDWKGADYGFGQPSYPWVNGRDFAGIVVKAPRKPSRIQQGDVVFGPSTDYRDVRKAAYQEYVVTTDYNVARVPQGVDVKQGAALGVAFVAAAISLGVSFGLNFSQLREAPSGPDLLDLVRRLDPRDVPEDIRDEIFGGITKSDRPRPGEWIAIWGANSNSGWIALQLDKLAGMKVACIADLANGGKALSELGADFMVDRHDTKRASEILKAVTGSRLRFGIDINGKDSAQILQQALQSSNSGKKSHILGLGGLPKEAPNGIVQHQVPIKIFHEDPNVGEELARWLEQLLVAKSLHLPDVEVADGGLAGVNAALDKLRAGTNGGRRIVVPVGAETSLPAPHTPSSGPATRRRASYDMSYADELNSDPERVKFAYWVPNVSGGLIVSKIPQRTHWDLRANEGYAQTAEQVGFEYALSQVRFLAGYGAENQHEPVSLSLAVMLVTQRIKFIAALLPGPWNPAVVAKMIASIDQYTEGRACVNVVPGWFKTEFTGIGEWWLDHSERYRRSREFMECLKGIWTQESFTYKGDFYQFNNYSLKPKPFDVPGRKHPPIFHGGNSNDAKENAGTVGDYYFMNGSTLETLQAQIKDVKERAQRANRRDELGFAINAFVICRESEEEAIQVLQEIQGKADADTVEDFRQQMQNSRASKSNRSGIWANPRFKDLLQYNDGFKTKLIGTKEQIAERIMLLKSLGAGIILTAFLHYEDEIEQFGKEVIPLVRQLEKQGRGKDEAYEVQQTGWIYSEKD